MPAIALVAGGAAILLLLLLLAGPIIIELCKRIVPSVGIGSLNFRSYVVNAVTAGVTGMRVALDDALIPVGYLVQGVALTLWWTVGLVTNALLQALSITATVGQSAAQTLQSAESYADHAALGAIHDAQHLYNLAVGHADAATLGAIHDAQHLYNLAIAHANAEALGAIHDAQHLYNLAVGHADALVTAVGQRVTSLEQLLVGDISGAVTSLDQQIAAAAAAATAEVNAAILQAQTTADQLAHLAATTTLGQLEAAVHDAVLGPWLALLPAIEPLIADLPAEVLAGLGLPEVLPTNLPASIPAILGLTIPLVGAITTELDRCLLGRCDALGEVNQVFQALKGLGLAALLAALVGEAVNDPHAAAGAIIDVGSWTGDVVIGMVDAILG